MKSRTPQLDTALTNFRHSVAPGVPERWRHLWSVAMWHHLLLAAAYGELKPSRAYGVRVGFEPARWIELKTDPAPWYAVESGRKTFEIRLNDRNYQPGDGLLLRRTRYTGADMKAGKPLEYLGEPLRRVVTHVMTGPLYGLSEGWAILSIAPYGVDVPRGGDHG